MRQISIPGGEKGWGAEPKKGKKWNPGFRRKFMPIILKNWFYGNCNQIALHKRREGKIR